MNGLELAALLRTLDRDALRRIFNQAAKEVGMTPGALGRVLKFRIDREAPFEFTFEAVWHVQCELRVFTKTGKKEWGPPNAVGQRKLEAVFSCDHTKAEAAVKRCLEAR